MIKASALTLARLKEVLTYDPETGLFIWRINRRGRAKAGTVAGADNGVGYIVIRLDGENHKAHRLAVFYMTGKWPIADTDHKNCKKSDNRWGNLRPATRSQNRANTNVRADNTSGFKGVVWDSKSSKWRAQTMVNGKRKYLGLFDKVEDAVGAYGAAVYGYFGPFARVA